MPTMHHRPNLTGDVGAMSLDDLVSWVAARHKTGVLRVERGNVRKMLVFEHGLLQYGCSSDPHDKLGHLLVKRRLISEERLKTALRSQERSGLQLGVLLVSEGAISAGQLQATLHAAAEQIAAGLLLWDDGSFVFQEGAPENLPLRARLDTRGLIEHAARRRQRVRRIRAAFHDDEVRFAARGVTRPHADPLRARILELATSGRTLAQIVREAVEDEFEVADYLLSLCEQGVLGVRDPGAPPPPEASAASTS